MTHAELMRLLLATLTHPEGAGSDLGSTEYEEPWLRVNESGRYIDVQHLASDILRWFEDRESTEK